KPAIIDACRYDYMPFVGETVTHNDELDVGFWDSRIYQGNVFYNRIIFAIAMPGCQCFQGRTPVISNPPLFHIRHRNDGKIDGPINHTYPSQTVVLSTLSNNVE